MMCPTYSQLNLVRNDEGNGTKCKQLVNPGKGYVGAPYIILATFL